MKKEYMAPDIDIINFSFEEMMANIDISTPEDFATDGGDIDF